MQLIIVNGPSGCGKSTTWLPRLSRALNAPICDTGDLFKAQLGYQRLVSSGKASSRPMVVNTGEEAFIAFRASGRYAAGLAEYDRQKATGECTGYDIIEHIETLRFLCPDMAARSVRAMQETLGMDRLITTAINQAELMDLLRLYWADKCILLTLIPEHTVQRSGQNRATVIPPENVIHNRYAYNWDSIDTVVDQAIADTKMICAQGGSHV
jgi:hypothetical protein